MKILHVITSLEMGGAEHLMVDLLPRLRGLDNDVELAVFKCRETEFYKQLKNSGIIIHVFSESESVYSLKHIIRLRKLIPHYDIVHTHNTACQLFAAIVKQKNSILVTTEHSTSTRRRRYKLLRFLDKWMYSRYNKTICISEPSEISLRNYIGNDYPIITIQNGIDVNKFVTANKIDIGLTNKIIITMVAGFRYEKDQPTVIKAIKYLPDNYHLLLIGDGERRNEFEDLIEELNLTSRIHLLGTRNYVPQILKSSDVIVMSSHREGLSLSNVEGMASGNPFIASDVDGLREVTQGYGLLFPHGDANELAAIILKVTSDKKFHDEVVKKCQERALGYDISVMANNYNQVYKELLDGLLLHH